MADIPQLFVIELELMGDFTGACGCLVFKFNSWCDHATSDYNVEYARRFTEYRKQRRREAGL